MPADVPTANAFDRGEIDERGMVSGDKTITPTVGAGDERDQPGINRLRWFARLDDKFRLDPAATQLDGFDDIDPVAVDIRQCERYSAQAYANLVGREIDPRDQQLQRCCSASRSCIRKSALEILRGRADIPDQIAGDSGSRGAA